MRRILFVIIIFCSLEANAQTHLISFAGTGASTTVSTVEVENLSAGTSIILNGDDILRLTTTTGVNSMENGQSSRLKIYPNPMTNQSKLLISAPDAGDAFISVYDITGRRLTRIKSYIENYPQEFTLSGFNTGLYFINVKGNTYQFSGKLISNGKSNKTVSINKASDNIAVYKKEIIMDVKGVQATVDLEYTPGDRLKFKGISGIYSTVKTDIPTEDKTVTFNFMACMDGDGNNYPVVQIGNQIWMAENLRTTHYLTGDPMGTTNPATLDIVEEISPKYQWAYGGIEANTPVYGRLYTWYAITDTRKVCPLGWHVPNDSEWATIEATVGGYTIASNILKETGNTHWLSPYNENATNESGFTGLPGGYRSGNGQFFLIQNDGYYWSSTESEQDRSWIRILNTVSPSVSRLDLLKSFGASIRCIYNLPIDYITIQEIQGIGDSSPYNTQNVGTTGIVTAYKSGMGYFIQDGTATRSGLYVNDGIHSVSVGDKIMIEGTVQEYFDLTELTSITSIDIISSGNPLPTPISLTTSDVNNENYESMLVQVNNVTCTSTLDSFNQWQVNDGTGICYIDDMLFYYNPVLSSSFLNIKGVLFFGNSIYRIEPRSAADITQF